MPSDRRLALTVQYACEEVDVPEIPSRTDIRRWARAAFIERPPQGGIVTIRFVDSEEGETLNRDYRGKNYATNVLSFAYDLHPVLTGDLVICPQVVAREAQEQKKGSAEHYAHLIVHGMLHLQGYEHENSNKDAEEMEALERRILADLGISDPYAIG